MLKSKVRFLKAKTEVIKKQKREESGVRNNRGNFKVRTEEEGGPVYPEQISTLQAMDGAMPEQLSIF